MSAFHTSHVLPAPALLRTAGLGVTFGRVRALDEVSLGIDTGSIVAITGEPGAGKSTLARCLGGDLAPTDGQVLVDGAPLPADPAAADRRGIAVVRQDLALCDNLSIADNLLLGHETRGLMLSESRFHGAAGEILDRLRIPIRDTTRLAGSLPGGQRQLLAVAKAMSRRPRLLVLDEPTVSLALLEERHVEELLAALRAQGTAIVLVSRDIKQMFRLADRIAVLRHGRVVAELDPRTTHPDDVTALLSDQPVDASARRQLTRLHGLADRLVSADPSSSLSLILSALGSALSIDRICIHVVDGPHLEHGAALGFAPSQVEGWPRLALGHGGGPAGVAAATGELLVQEDAWISDASGAVSPVADGSPTSTAWCVPVVGPDGVCAVITILRPQPGPPQQDELDLLTLYGGYAASAIERDRLLKQATARNRVLETIREMLQTLAGPVEVGEGLTTALQSLRHGLQADEVALVTRSGDGTSVCRAYAGTAGAGGSQAMSPTLRAAAGPALHDYPRDGSARIMGRHREVRSVPFNAPGGPTALLAAWATPRAPDAEISLLEDAAHSLNLALEGEEAGLAHQEAAALRRSRELQRDFLSRLSHELRTPLTAIRGYASSLMQPDVTWDESSQARFLARIAAESARVERLVDDLLDFSAIEAGIMRMHRDWCDIQLVVEAAASCLPSHWRPAVTIACSDATPVIYADHDRLEQVFVNLLTNALRHNPPGTRVRVEVGPVMPAAARPAAAPGRPAPAEVEITVHDDGTGLPADLAAAPFEPARQHRAPSSGAGLGLSIARGIIEAHEGRIELLPAAAGTAFRIRLPVEAVDAADAGGAPGDAATEELAGGKAGR